MRKHIIIVGHDRVTAYNSAKGKYIHENPNNIQSDSAFIDFLCSRYSGVKPSQRKKR